MIYFSNNKKGFLPKLIRFFTKSNVSHCGIICDPFENIPSAIESSDLVQIVPFSRNYIESKNEEYILFKLSGEAEVPATLGPLFIKYAGLKYGYFQLIWFMWRWLTNLFGVDISRQKNWFTNNVICSELVYDYFIMLNHPDVNEKLKDFNQDTVQADDLLNIVISLPHVFEFVESKGSL